MSLTRSYLRLHFIVFLWGFTAILGLLISIPAVEMVFLRTLLAAGGLGILLLVTHRPFKLATTDYLPVILTGFIISAHWITFLNQPDFPTRPLAWWVLPLTLFGQPCLSPGLKNGR